VPAVDLELECDPKRLALFRPANSQGTAWQRTLHVQADKQGSAQVQLRLESKPGKAKIKIIASNHGITQAQEVSLESIDSSEVLNQVQDVELNAQSDRFTINWSEAPDNRTCFIIERRVDKIAWRTIALVPGDVTTYTDTNIAFDDGLHEHHYEYRVSSSNSPKFGYPPHLPPPPDRLGDFLPE
jgi:hypothetical protein